ncbi:MAG: carbon storage regulator [Sulfurifustis sp.]
MLVLTRKVGEQVIIGPGGDKADESSVYLVVIGVKGNSVRFGIRAPDDVKILRAELSERDRASRNGKSKTG